MFSFLGIALGLILLIAGGGLLVRGASEIAAGFGVSPMIVGLTVVGFGTSSPELVVNVVGALEGRVDEAFCLEGWRRFFVFAISCRSAPTGSAR